MSTAEFVTTQIRHGPACLDDGIWKWTSEASRYRGGRRPAGTVDPLLSYEFQVYGPNSWKRP